MKEKIAVICPGRGTYTKETLGYLKKFRPGLNDFFGILDEKRQALAEVSISDLDNEPQFKPGLHTKGENASALIYACSYADFLSLDPQKYEVVAVTGNSMGWYIAMAVAGALDVRGAFDVINTMGSMMKDKIIGGQIIYPVVDDNWHRLPEKVDLIATLLTEVNAMPGCEAFVSIHLGGYEVIGGNPPALEWLLKKLPKIENYPFQLINHAAFHTPLLQSTSKRAFEVLSPDLFHHPKLPLIDGRGFVWNEFNSDLDDLYQYTLGHQVTEIYDFTKAVTVTLKEFCPDRLALLGPGGSLGGSIGQILVANQWRGIKSKADFSAAQKTDPFLLSLGRLETT